MKTLDAGVDGDEELVGEVCEGEVEDDEESDVTVDSVVANGMHSEMGVQIVRSKEPETYEKTSY